MRPALLGHFYNAERVLADHGRLMRVAEVLGRDGGQAYAKETCGAGTAEGAALYVVQVCRQAVALLFGLWVVVGRPFGVG